MNAPVPPEAAMTKAALERAQDTALALAFHIVAIAECAPSTTRTQARRRERFGKEEQAALAASIKAVGIMQPIVVRPHPKPLAPVKYEIVAGERRWLAAGEAGLKTVPVVVRQVPTEDLVQFQLVENLQRKTVDVIGEAEGYDELRKAKKITSEQIAELVGVSRTTVFDRLKLLDLCPEASGYLHSGKLQASVALLIARIPDPKMQAKAAKGCATARDLGNFDPEESAFDHPLTHQDAEKYIKEEFTARIEGTAAINKAKTEGKAVIAGKEAEEIWKRSHGGPAGHVELGEHYWTGNSQRKSYAAVLGDNPPGMVLIQNPHTGAAAKCLPRADAIRIFKEKKVTLPSDLEPRNAGSSSAGASDKPQTPAGKAKAEAERAKEFAKKQREEMKEQLEADVRIATFKAARAKYPSKLGKAELLELLELVDDYGMVDVDPELAPRPKSLNNCSERELVRFVLDNLYCVDPDDGYSRGDDNMFAAAKRYGVNLAKIRKELTEKAEAKLKGEAEPKKKVGKK